MQRLPTFFGPERYKQVQITDATGKTHYYGEVLRITHANGEHTQLWMPNRHGGRDGSGVRCVEFWRCQEVKSLGSSVRTTL